MRNLMQSGGRAARSKVAPGAMPSSTNTTVNLDMADREIVQEMLIISAETRCAHFLVRNHLLSTLTTKLHAPPNEL